MSTTLASFQASFFDALLAEPDAVADAPFARQPGFAVYRNTVMAGCIEALEANYPTVRGLVGDARFREIARAFVRAEPPSDGVIAGYGAGLAAWLDAQPEDAGSTLVGSVATLDRAWTEAHLAADAPLLEPGALIAFAAERFASSRLVPHPAARWLALAAPQAFAAWRGRREGGIHDDVERRDEGALLTRPDGAVVWTSIDRAAVAFLDACAEGNVVADALEAAAAAEPGSDVARWLPALMHARAFTRIESRSEGDVSQGNVALPLSLIPAGDGRREAAALGRS